MAELQTPQALVASILAGKMSMEDSRPFCNQLAWLLSGENIDYTTVRDIDEAKRCATCSSATVSQSFCAGSAYYLHMSCYVLAAVGFDGANHMKLW